MITPRQENLRTLVIVLMIGALVTVFVTYGCGKARAESSGDCTYLNGKLILGDRSCPLDELGVDPNYEEQNPAASEMQDDHDGDMYECHQSGDHWICQQQMQPMPTPAPSPDEDEQDSFAI